MREEIIRMAREAGFGIAAFNAIDGYEVVTSDGKIITDEIERFYSLVAAAKKEECEPEYMFHDGLNTRANLISAINEINHSEIHQDRVDAEKWREWRMNGFSPIYPMEYAIFWVQKSREMCANMSNDEIVDAVLRDRSITL